jgi:hypothetical protein
MKAEFLHVCSATSHEMQHEQYQADNQCDMNESSGHVKCEESKQPKDDQDKSDYREHIFISLLLSAKDIRHCILWKPG